MTSVCRFSESVLRSGFNFLNYHKEGIKNILGTIAFTFGVMECYDLYKVFKHRKISPEKVLRADDWIQMCKKVMIIAGRTSLILNAGVSRPGVFLISNIMGKIFTTQQLDRFFGPNSTFVVNPWHPRHLTNIAVSILSAPMALQSTYLNLIWINKKIRNYRKSILTKTIQTNAFVYRHLRMKVFFTFMTCRTTLHCGNQVVRYLLRN